MHILSLIFLCNLSKNYILKKFLSEIKVSHTDINMFFIIFFLVRWSVLQTWAAYLGIHNLENSWFFCQSDFTWNQFWVILKAHKLPFWPFEQLWILNFGNFWNFQMWNSPKNQYSKPTKLFKQQFFTFRNQLQLISR